MIPLTDFVDRFDGLESVVLEAPQPRRLAVRSVRAHKQQLLIALETITTRNDAEKHIGEFLSVTRAELVELPEGTWFQFDVVGMEVRSEDGEVLGRIVEVVEMPANDIWRVEGLRSFNLPASGNIILKVDRTARVVTIRILEGLLDLQ